MKATMEFLRHAERIPAKHLGPACRGLAAMTAIVALGRVLWGEGDSDVAFHDNESFMINAGVVYRFGARAAPASAAR